MPDTPADWVFTIVVFFLGFCSNLAADYIKPVIDRRFTQFSEEQRKIREAHQQRKQQRYANLLKNMRADISEVIYVNGQLTRLAVAFASVCLWIFMMLLYTFRFQEVIWQLAAGAILIMLMTMAGRYLAEEIIFYLQLLDDYRREKNLSLSITSTEKSAKDVS